MTRDGFFALDATFFGPQQPQYPPLIQVVRVTSSTISGPSDSSSSSSSSSPVRVYVSFTTQNNPSTLRQRDREPCLVIEPNGNTLSAGFYIARLVGSYTGLPVYMVVSASGATSSITSTDPFVIPPPPNKADSSSSSVSSSVVITVSGGLGSLTAGQLIQVSDGNNIVFGYVSLIINNTQFVFNTINIILGTAGNVMAGGALITFCCPEFIIAFTKFAFPMPDVGLDAIVQLTAVTDTTVWMVRGQTIIIDDGNIPFLNNRLYGWISNILDRFTFICTTTRIGSGLVNNIMPAGSSVIISGDPNPTFNIPLTTKGDIYGFDTAGARIPVGADGTILTADSTKALGVKWNPPAATPTTVNVCVKLCDGTSGCLTVPASWFTAGPCPSTSSSSSSSPSGPVLSLATYSSGGNQDSGHTFTNLTVPAGMLVVVLSVNGINEGTPTVIYNSTPLTQTDNAGLPSGNVSGQLFIYYLAVSAGTHDLVVSATGIPATSTFEIQVVGITGLLNNVRHSGSNQGGTSGNPTIASVSAPNNSVVIAACLMAPGGSWTWGGTPAFTSGNQDLTDTIGIFGIAQTQGYLVVPSITNVSPKLDGITPAQWQFVETIFN